MPPEDPVVPCGLVAKSYFNDTFKLYKKESDSNGALVVQTDADG